MACSTGSCRSTTIPPQVEALVAEAALLTALIGQTIKLRWKLSLAGARRRAGAHHRHRLLCRRRARCAGTHPRLGLLRRRHGSTRGRPGFEQIGEGYFAILIDQGAGNHTLSGHHADSRWHRLSPVQRRISPNPSNLPTRFALSFGRSRSPGGAERWRAGGVMLQHMPKASPLAAAGQAAPARAGCWRRTICSTATRARTGRRANLLLDTVEEMELIGPSVAADRPAGAAVPRGGPAGLRCPAGRASAAPVRPTRCARACRSIRPGTSPT